MKSHQNYIDLFKADAEKSVIDYKPIIEYSKGDSSARLAFYKRDLDEKAEKFKNLLLNRTTLILDEAKHNTAIDMKGLSQELESIHKSTIAKFYSLYTITG